LGSRQVKVSIITVVYNGENTIKDTLISVASQTYPNIEHIVIDGASTDNTLDVIHKWGEHVHCLVSEPDKGIYDAMNKGIALAAGDIIGILNADDMYMDENCIADIVHMFREKRVDAVCGDLIFVRSENLEKPIRYFPAKGFTVDQFAYGIMPPHPAVFLKRKCYQNYGLFKTDYIIAADFEILVRFFKTHKIRFCCLPRTLVKMRTGGISTKGLKSTWILNTEIMRACRENNIPTHAIKILFKYVVKVRQLFF
jgi:glycosyltransferase involved in cell wall biosynthesis